MKFDVRITFDGLYLLAVNEPKKIVHVVLMNFGEDVPCGGGSHEMSGPMPMPMNADHPKHFPMLYFDAAHTAQAPALRQEMTGHLYGISLKNRALHLDGPTAADLNFDPRIASLSDVAGAGPLDPSHVGKQPVRAVGGRVTLSTGKPLPVTRSTVYDVIPADPAQPTVEREIASRVDWLISDLEDPIGRLKLELRSLDKDSTSTPEKTQVLLPVEVTRMVGGVPQTRQEIHLHIYCAAAPDLPGGVVIRPPQVGDVVPHVSGFFQLFPGVGVPTLRIKKVQQTGTTETCIGLRTTVG
jgi:hypothetical protein